MKSIVFRYGIALFVAAVFALSSRADAVADSFEENTCDWTAGTNAVATVSSDAITAYGYPISDAAHTKVLSIDGTTTRDLTEAISDANIVDALFMFKAREGTLDSSCVPSGTLCALACASDGSLVLYAATQSAGIPSFQTLGTATYTDGTWVRITIVVEDWATGKLVVAIDGVAQDGDYYIPTGNSAISSIEVAGETSIDDVVARKDTVTSSTYDPYATVKTTGEAAVETSTEDSIAVPAVYIAKKVPSGKTINDTIDSSRLTYAQAYWLGVDPEEGASFEIEECETSSDGITITFPGSWPAGAYTVGYGSSPDACDTAATPSSSAKSNSKNVVTVPFDFSSSSVIYYKVGR